MKTRTKITVTLAVGIGLLIGSMGVASASPHYSDYNGRPSFTALDNSFSHNLEWDLKAPVSSFIKLGDIKGAVEAPVSSFIKLGDIKGAVEAPVSSYIKLGDIKGAVEAPVSSWREDGANRLHDNRSGLHDSVHCLRNTKGKSTATLNRGYRFRECSAL